MASKVSVGAENVGKVETRLEQEVLEQGGLGRWKQGGPVRVRGVRKRLERGKLKGWGKIGARRVGRRKFRSVRTVGVGTMFEQGGLEG
jgi:hypothetical protein